MNHKRRWDPCVAHCGSEVDGFLDHYFAQPNRKVFLVAGAGFDPRSCAVSARLSNTAASIRGLFIQEKRPNPLPNQSDRAGKNIKILLSKLTDPQVVPVEIFGPDGAVVGGRNIVSVLSQQDLESATDVIVDVSALSTGTSFPIIRYFVECMNQGKGYANLHVFVVHDPRLDDDIRSIDSDVPSYVHGFKGRSTLSDKADAAKLWLPQLATRRYNALQLLYDFIAPHDTCPILPFPASNPRLGDLLAEEYLTQLEDTWEVDTRNIVYANEDDPLDLYRTILKLDDLRRPVFEETGGSMLILSPLGSKVMTLGALMAALERDLPVAHLEPIGYELKETVPEEIKQPNFIHIWLEGDVYPQPRPSLPTEGSTAQ